MGRSLVKGNIKNNIKRLINHLNQWPYPARFVGSLTLKL
jgi:hypothetical protein